MGKGYEVGLATSLVKRITATMENLTVAPGKVLNALSLEENISSFAVDPESKDQEKRIGEQKKTVRKKVGELSVKANAYLRALSSLQAEIETLGRLYKLPPPKKKKRRSEP
jgi:hypothetical protein